LHHFPAYATILTHDELTEARTGEVG
jgi:hypothetical protein